MNPDVVFSGIAVTDFPAAVTWYERVFGRNADIVVNDNEVMWRMTDSAWIYVVKDEARAGRALVALSVPSLEDALHELSRRGVDAGPTEVVGEAGRKAAVTDSDGNAVALIEVEHRGSPSGGTQEGHHVHASFDDRAATWDDDPGKVRRARAVAAAIEEALPLGRQVRLLEYGAGTGLVTEALRDRVGPLTLADTSAGMRDVMAGKVAAGALPEARIWDLDLSSDALPDERFDLIVVAMTLHHIPALPPVLSAFATLLDPGGHLCVADLEEEDGSFHGEGFHGHRGFRRAELQALLTEAGFADVTFRPCGEIRREGGTFPVFLATARRP